MKLSYFAISLACVALACGACHNPANDGIKHEHHDHEGHDEHDHEGHNEHDHEGHDHEGHDHEGHSHEGHDESEHLSGGKGNPDIITLSPQAASRLGVGTQKITPRPFGGALKVSGTVAVSSRGNAVVAAPTSGIITLNRGIEVGSEVGRGTSIGTIRAEGVSGGDANQVAKAELTAATAEFNRVKALYADRLVTLGEYNAAKGALDRAKAAYSAKAATGSVTSPAPGVITELTAVSGQYVNAGEPIASVSSDKDLTVRADVPVRHYKEAAATRDARIVSSATGADILVSEAGGKRTGVNGSSAATTGGFVPVYFSFPNTGALLPGTAVEIYLLSPDEREVLSVPNSALVEQQGAFYIFQRLDDDCYRKVPVTRGRTDGSRTEITSGLTSGMEIVTAGTTAVKLAQSSGAVPAGHSHSH